MTSQNPPKWSPLPIPRNWPAARRRLFLDYVQALATSIEGSGDSIDAKRILLRSRSPSLVAATHIVSDLVEQGWNLRVDGEEHLSVAGPEPEEDPAREKDRVKRQEQLKRDEQLRLPSVRAFIGEMEKPREFRGEFVSIFSLMRDGPQLADCLRRLANHEPLTPEGLRGVIDPYVQIVSTGDRCRFTGLRLLDVWRYFRHTWTNQYTSTPGRSMLLLVRDRAAPFHPVIGIAALGSAIIQIRERDEWIGWEPTKFVEHLAEHPGRGVARWLLSRLQQTRDELYLADLVKDGLYWPSLWRSPTREAIDRLIEEAKRSRRNHKRFVRRSDFKWNVDEVDSWESRAQSPLFRSKRCAMLAQLLDARLRLMPLTTRRHGAQGLREALSDANSRRAVLGIIRRAKADAVGTEIADLTVCGAIAPYNLLLGGKLVSMLAVGPTLVRAYHQRYRSYAGEISSSLAGRPISRRSNLVFVGTTSLYGGGSSQYNRVRLPANLLGNQEAITFQVLGKSRSFGTSHLSRHAIGALVRLAERSQNGVRVNSIFGEGVNPKLRKVREGLDLLDWPSDELLKHGRPRVVYGVALATNLLPYLLGLNLRPRYVFDRTMIDDVEQISAWWMERWLARRVTSTQVLDDVASHSLSRPVHHGARVALPHLLDTRGAVLEG